MGSTFLRVRFTSQGGVISLEFAGLENVQIGGSLVTHSDEHDITYDKVGGIELLKFAITDSHTLGWDQVQEGFEKSLRLLLLVEFNEGIEERHGNKNSTKISLGEGKG
jgi:hypothetical protein